MNRPSPKRIWSVLGLSFLTLAMLPLALSGGELPVPWLFVCLGAGSIGLGLSWAGLQTAVVETVHPDQVGAAAGIYATSRYLGSIVGSSLLAGFLAGGSAGFTTVFWMVLLGAGLSALVSLRLEDRPQPR